MSDYYAFQTLYHNRTIFHWIEITGWDSLAQTIHLCTIEIYLLFSCVYDHKRLYEKIWVDFVFFLLLYIIFFLEYAYNSIQITIELKLWNYEHQTNDCEIPIICKRIQKMDMKEMFIIQHVSWKEEFVFYILT